MHRLTKGKLIFLAFLIVASMLIITRHSENRYIENQGNVFGTTYHITYSYTRDLQQAIDQAR